MSERRTPPSVSRPQALFILLICLFGLITLVAMALRDRGPAKEIGVSIPKVTQSETIAEIFGDPITQNQLDAARHFMNAGDTETSSDLTDEMILKRLIEQKLLAQLALDLKADEDPIINNRILYLKEKTLASEAVKRFLSTAVSEDEVVEFYENELRFLKGRIQIKARQIVVPDEAMAVEINRRLDKGEAFGTLALAYSTDRASREFGGDLGFLNRDMVEPQIGDAIFAASNNTRLDPIQTSQGWHVIEVLSRRPIPILSLEERRPEILRLLQSKALETRLSKMRQDANIKISENLTPEDLDEE